MVGGGWEGEVCHVYMMSLDLNAHVRLFLNELFAL